MNQSRMRAAKIKCYGGSNAMVDREKNPRMLTEVGKSDVQKNLWTEDKSKHTGR